MKRKSIYISSVMSELKYDQYFGQTQSAINAQKFHSNIILGLSSNSVKLRVISVPPFNSANSTKKFIFLKREEFSNYDITYLPVVNFKLLRPIVFMLSATFYLLLFIIKDHAQNLIFDGLKYSTSFPATVLGKLTRRNTIVIYTDIPEHLNNYNIFKRMIFKIVNKASAFILLSEFMNEVVNKQNKSSVIVEGIFDENDFNNIKPKSFDTKSNILMYAGNLDEENGIVTLIEGFLMMKNETFELHFYGEGNSVNRIKEFESMHHNIKYCGSQSRNFIKTKEVEAFLLINPRPSSLLFSKFSFPSKTMEYLGSGTPVLMTKIPSMPKEYFDYVFLVNDETPTGFCRALHSIIKMDKEELFNFGLKAKQFVIDEKNVRTQTTKILKLLLSGGN